ncbi:hypothetical protein JCM14469_15960 [Desulfatiferula olefinivorans]
MAVWEEIRHQVAVVGTVTGSADGRAMVGVRVAIVDGPVEWRQILALREALAGEAWPCLARRPDRVTTGTDGRFHFMDLPDGDYVLSAYVDGFVRRYGRAEQTVTVSRTPGGDIHMARADLVLPVSRIRGRILRQGTDTPVPMAEIRMTGCADAARSDADGAFSLAGVEAAPGPRPMTVRAVGYQDRTVTVTLSEAGAEAVAEVMLVPR